MRAVRLANPRSITIPDDVAVCAAGTNFEIGDGWQNGHGRTWKGKMKKFAIYQDVLDPDQVKQLYDSRDVPYGEDPADDVSQAEPLTCNDVSQPDVSPTTCYEGVTADIPLWMDRSYAWTTGPSDILAGGWVYFRVSLEPGAGAPSGVPCDGHQVDGRFDVYIAVHLIWAGDRFFAMLSRKKQNNIVTI